VELSCFSDNGDVSTVGVDFAELSGNEDEITSDISNNGDVLFVAGIVLVDFAWDAFFFFDFFILLNIADV